MQRSEVAQTKKKEIFQRPSSDIVDTGESMVDKVPGRLGSLSGAGMRVTGGETPLSPLSTSPTNAVSCWLQCLPIVYRLERGGNDS